MAEPVTPETTHIAVTVCAVTLGRGVSIEAATTIEARRRTRLRLLLLKKRSDGIDDCHSKLRHVGLREQSGGSGRIRCC
eukprot:212227-Chlamydomonas_euryale.AAC.1